MMHKAWCSIEEVPYGLFTHSLALEKDGSNSPKHSWADSGQGGIWNKSAQNSHNPVTNVF